MLSKISQKKKNMYDITYIWSLKIKQSSEYNEKEIEREQSRIISGEREEGGAR